jgi:cysteine-rich repeat protein
MFCTSSGFCEPSDDAGGMDVGGMDSGAIDANGTDGGGRDAEPIDDAGDAAVVPGCGDGIIDPNEGCDDDDITSGDGCNSACTVEGGWTCIGEPSDCTRNPASPRTYVIEVPEPETTGSPTFIDVPGASLSFTPLDPSEIWIVFVSGTLSSSTAADVGAELRLMIGGAEADLLGHTTSGAGDDTAGFLTFDRITGSVAAQTIAVQLRAASGTATVENLRIVAALLPGGSDFHYFSDAALLERTALAQALETLPVQVPADGEYFVFGKTSQSAAPSGGAVQSWIETSAGDVRPDAPSGTRFTNSRTSWQPMFTMFRTALTQGAQSIALVGSSPGDAAAPVWADPSYVYRANIRVDAPATTMVPAGHPVSVSFDHQNLVPNRALASGDDLRVFYFDGAWTELPRVVDPASDWGLVDTTIWFDTAAAIAASGSDANYYLYYGNEAPPSPFDDPLAIFTFFDDFSGSALDTTLWTLVGGSVTVQNGQMTLDPSARIFLAPAYRTTGRMIAEARATLPAGTPATISWMSISDGTGYLQNFARLYSDGADQRFEYGRPNMTIAGFVSPNTGAPHTYAIVRPPDGAIGGPIFLEDTRVLRSGGSDPPLGTASMGVLLRNDSTSAGPVYDWVRVRSLLAAEPTAAVGSEEAHSGALPSRWLHRKLMAFRSDAWDFADASESSDLDTTAMSLFVSKTSLSSPVPNAEQVHLVIQSMRISADDANGSRRRAGILRRDGAVRLETSHRIDADGSRLSGYHHNAAMATVVTTSAMFTLENGFASPDGATVEAADSAIVLLRYPP